MDWNNRLQEAQQQLQNQQIDGWLLYDFQGINGLARNFLQIPSEMLTTRRFFYWIPAKGVPVKVLHKIEPHVLDGLPGKPLIYLKWQELEAALGSILSGAKRVAMEFSPRCAIPYLSKVDAGMVDLVRSFDVEVLSSAPLLQTYTSTLTSEQLQSHLDAADFLDKLAEKTWNKISDAMRKGQRLCEYEVRQFMAQEFLAHGYVSEGMPICAVNAHSADPHFEPAKEGSAEIKRGDFILIDLWCKKSASWAIYGDITRVAVADDHPTERQQEIYSLVRKAQKAATDFVIGRYGKGESIKGFEVDQLCRSVIEEGGYGQYFTHRTGHNIHTKDHGPGAHIDSLETLDLRELIPHTCFSIEPGIYLPGEFGIRQEYDLYLGDEGEVQITGGIQDEIVTLL